MLINLPIFIIGSNVSLPAGKYTELNKEFPNTLNFVSKVFTHFSKL